MIARANRDLGGAENEPAHCPGETNCDRFQAAAGTDRATKGANACSGCSLFPTKAAADDRSARECEWTLNVIERIRRERDSGGGVDLNAIGPAIWELIQLWDAVRDRQERHFKYEIREMLLTLLAAKGT